MWNGMEAVGWGWIGLGAVHMLLFWGLVALGIAALVRGASPDAGGILKARYARGEITREQFERMKQDIAG